MKLKHKLPIYNVIDHLCIDDILLKELQNVVIELETEFLSVLEVNKSLCGIHHELTKSVYDNFFQISLTDSIFNTDKIDLDACEVVHDDLHKSRSSENIRHKKMISSLTDSPLNENTYTQQTETYIKYKEVFDKVISKFKGKPTRIRLVKLNAGTNIAPHIDYDPSYAVRVIIPIFSTPECVNIFWEKNEVRSMFFEPGKAYFLNTGYKHAVMNFSKHDRYTFMISVAGIDDIDHMIS
jgi:Aspartyl/Asparaginyl beta-hydroxylase